MTAHAFRPTSALGIATILASSAGLCALILLGGIATAPRLWGLLGILAICMFSMWRLSLTTGLTLQRIDQLAWALMICHTVLVARIRHPKVLAEEQSLSNEIAVEIGIWSVLLLYAGLRLIADPSRLKNLWGSGGRYASLLLATAVASAINAASPLITLAWSVKLFAIISLGCVLFDRRDPIGSGRRFVTATYWGLALMLVEFLILGLLSPESAMAWSSTGVWRAGGFLIPSTQLSAVAGMVAIIALIDILARRSGRFTLLTLAISLALMLASIGRGGMLATAVAMALAITAFRKMHLALCLALISALILLAVPDAIDTTWHVLSRGQSEGEIMSLTGRVQLWQTVVELIAMKPLLGWGYVSGGRVALLSAFHWWPATHTHNAFLEMLLALGLLGGLILSLLMWKTYASLARYLRREWSSIHSTDRSLDTLKVLSLMVLLTIEGLFAPGFSGAPRAATALLIGSAFFADHLRLEERLSS